MNETLCAAGEAGVLLALIQIRLAAGVWNHRLAVWMSCIVLRNAARLLLPDEPE